MLQHTQEEEKKVSKNYNTNEHVMQVELETYCKEDNFMNVGSSRLGD